MLDIFSFPQYLTFPKRDEALRSIWELVHSWIRKNGMYRNQVRSMSLEYFLIASISTVFQFNI